MAAVFGSKGTDDGELVVELGEFMEGGAEGDAGDTGGDFSGSATDVAGGAHFGVKGFELAGASVHHEEDDGFVPDDSACLFYGFLGFQ